MKTKITAAGMAVLLAWAVPLRAQEQPRWLVEAKARESKLTEPADVASEDGWLRSRVPAALKGKVTLDDGIYSLDFALDGSSAVSCAVVRGSRDMAAYLVQTAESSFAELQQANGTLEARVVEQSDAGSLGPHPYLALQWVYRANRQGERRLGGLKQFIAEVDAAVVYCLHDDLGYARSFETVTRALASNLRTTDDPAMPKPHFREVSVVSVDGLRVGVVTTTLSRDADGDTKVVNRSALLLQAAPGQLVTQDSVEVQWVRADGALINAAQVKSGNGQLSEDMTLQRDEQDRWRARGKINGKPVDAEVTGTPASFVALAKARRQLMAQAEPAGTRTDAMTWSSLDLTRLLPARATMLAPVAADRYAVREEIGGVAIESVLDRQTGTMASARMQLGPRTMNFERVHRQGEP